MFYMLWQYLDRRGQRPKAWKDESEEVNFNEIKQNTFARVTERKLYVTSYLERRR